MIYPCGVFELDSEPGELRKNGHAVRIERQPAKTLVCLLENAADIVTRDQMRLAIWGEDTHVDFDRGLAYCLSPIRSSLGDSAENPRFLQTLPRKGYRFLAPVVRLQGDPPKESGSANVGIGGQQWQRSLL